MIKRMRNEKGFSLVELIIVIAIMAIVAGVVAPTVFKYVDKARRRTIENDAKAVYTAANSAIIDFFSGDLAPGNDHLGLEDSAEKFLDEETGEVVGRITTQTIGAIMNNPNNPGVTGQSQVDLELSKSICKSIGMAGKWATTSPSGQSANYTGGKYYAQITYTQGGVLTVELCKNKYYTIYDGTSFTTSKYSGSEQPKFHNVKPTN